MPARVVQLTTFCDRCMLFAYNESKGYGKGWEILQRNSMAMAWAADHYQPRVAAELSPCMHHIRRSIPLAPARPGLRYDCMRCSVLFLSIPVHRLSTTRCESFSFRFAADRGVSRGLLAVCCPPYSGFVLSVKVFITI